MYNFMSVSFIQNVVFFSKNDFFFFSFDLCQDIIYSNPKLGIKTIYTIIIIIYTFYPYNNNNNFVIYKNNYTFFFPIISSFLYKHIISIYKHTTLITKP